MAQNLHLCKMDESVCVSKHWCLHLFGVMASSIFSVWWPNLNTQFYLIEQTFTSHSEKKDFSYVCAWGVVVNHWGQVLLSWEMENLKAKSIKKREPSQGCRFLGWALLNFADIMGLGKCFTHIYQFVCSFPKNNFIKLPLAGYLSEWVCAGFL